MITTHFNDTVEELIKYYVYIIRTQMKAQHKGIEVFHFSVNYLKASS